MNANPRTPQQARARTARLASWRDHAVSRMERTRASTLRFLSRLPKQVILEPRTQARWSIKDTFAHIVAWEEDAVRRLALIQRGRGARIRFYNEQRSVDRFNARAVRRAARLSWPALLRRAGRVRRRLVHALRRVPPPALQDPAHRYTVLQWLPEFAWTHEQAHIGRIRRWWRA